ncbi:MAG: nucleoside phosphorylase [Chloroflexi bacterium]|nr:nucleoside phosphorylase [Chloroflexota bacterium]
MSIPYDPSPPLVTPAQVLKEQCERQGVPAASLRLPPVLVGTFQGASFSHLIARVGADQPSSRSDGTAIETGVTIGKTSGGDPIAVARLPAGAPAAVIALEEAIARGVRSILVVGSAGSLQPDLPVGSTVIVTGAVREEGTSYHYLPSGESVRADPEIVSLLTRCAGTVGAEPTKGPAWTTDAPYRETIGSVERHRTAGVKVVEMEASAIFALSQVRRVRAGLLVAVSDELFDSWRPGFHDPAYLESLTRCVDATIAAAEQLTADERTHSAGPT